MVEKKNFSCNFVLALTGYSHRRKYLYLKVEADRVVLYDKYRSWAQRVLTAARNGRDLRKDPGLVVPDELPSLISEIEVHGPQCRFCRFSDGHIGWVLLEVAVGDQMAIFLGALAPMLLRPQNDTYLIVGESYIYEIMDGEALKDPSLKVETIKLV